jgi:hypothetical protein
VYSDRTVETVRGCLSMKKYKSQGKPVEVTVKSKGKTLRTFVWILSKNSAPVDGAGKGLISMRSGRGFGKQSYFDTKGG